jgi:hypothetical protein
MAADPAVRAHDEMPRPVPVLLISMRPDEPTARLINYLGEENRVLRERLGQKRLRFNRSLSNLDHQVGRGTIAEMLARHGMEPAPEWERKTTRKEFLTQHK